jgi:hypothetical protein
MLICRAYKMENSPKLKIIQNLNRENQEALPCWELVIWLLIGLLYLN